ncbi:MAG TPA: phage holin family protein [Candidatus Saccharimonadales bacterium]|nr:phage holin family protein [Candidatus Saccharimonadales bacterium]
MNIILKWIINALVIMVAAYLLPGVHVMTFWTALVVALVLGILNMLVKPLLIILTLPFTIITFGLFLLVINALLVLLAGVIVPGFRIDGFWWAFFFSIIISLINLALPKE